jgi:hypothetical protein
MSILIFGYNNPISNLIINNNQDKKIYFLSSNSTSRESLIFNYSDFNQIPLFDIKDIYIISSILPSHNASPDKYIRFNLYMQNVLLIISTFKNLNKINFLSSFSVYPSDTINVNDSTETLPTSDYSNFKINFELFLKRFYEEGHCYSINIFRIPVLLYHQVSSNFLGKIINKIKEDNTDTIFLSNQYSKFYALTDIYCINKYFNFSNNNFNIFICYSNGDIDFDFIGNYLISKYNVKLEWINSDRESISINSPIFISSFGTLPSTRQIFLNWINKYEN